MVRIAHLADIHIQNRRRDVYKKVFDELYAKLRDDAVDIIVVAGDIFDNKLHASANNLMDVADFLSNLADIAPVVAIPGNHDTNCLVPGSLDLLTPLLSKHQGLQPPRLNYWRNSGTYYAHDIVWTVIATDGEQLSIESEKKITDLYPDSLHICLFHEEVNYAKMPNGMEITNFKLNKEDLARYDVSMGGHIHIRQLFMPNAAYCGSLVQQNIGETVDGHGYLLWTIEGRKVIEARGVDIISDHGFVRVRIDERGNDVTPQPIPNCPEYWEVVYASEEADDVVKKYVEKFKSQPRAIRFLHSGINICDDIPDESQDIQHIQISAAELQTHETIIREILGSDSDMLADIIALHKEKYVPQQHIAGGKFRLLNIAFDNMYAFGRENYVDFTKLEHCVSGVIAANHTGKSSLIDTILFALYDEHPRSTLKKDIINIGAQLCKLRLEFELDGKPGYIEKGFSSKKSAIASMYKFNYAGEELTQGSTTGTLAEIKRVLGNADIALASSFQIQGGEYTGFVAANPNERKKLLATVLSLGIFDEIEKTITKDMTAAGAEIKMLERQGCGVNVEELCRNLSATEVTQEETDKCAELAAKLIELRAHKEQSMSNYLDAKSNLTDYPADCDPGAICGDLQPHQLDKIIGAINAPNLVSTAKFTQNDIIFLRDSILSDKMPKIADASELKSRLENITKEVADIDADHVRLSREIEECRRHIVDLPKPAELPYSVEWPNAKSGNTPTAEEVESARTLANYQELALLTQKSAMWNELRYTQLCDQKQKIVITDSFEELIARQKEVAELIQKNIESKTKAINTAETLGEFAENALLKYPNIVHKTIENPDAKLAAAKEALAATKYVDKIKSAWQPNDKCTNCKSIHTMMVSAETQRATAEVAELSELQQKYKAGQLRKVKEVIAKKIAVEAELNKTLKDIELKLRDIDRVRMIDEQINIMKAAEPFYYEMRKVMQAIDIMERARYHTIKAKESADMYNVKMTLSNQKAEEFAEKTSHIEFNKNTKLVLQENYAKYSERLNSINMLNSMLRCLYDTCRHYKAALCRQQYEKSVDAVTALENELQAANVKVETKRLEHAKLEVQYNYELKRSAELSAAQRNYSILKAYKSILRPNGGIADKLLEHARMTFNRRLIEALRELGAKFVIDLNDKFELYISSTQDTQMLPASLASGYQKFVLGLASRLAIWRLSSIPRPDAFIIDEGFGACDDDYLDLMANALEALSVAPDGPRLVFIVSHVDALKTRLERSIDLITMPNEPTRVNNANMIVAPIIVQNTTQTVKQEYKCEVCNQELKTSATFNKHLISAKHIKNLQKNNLQ